MEYDHVMWFASSGAWTTKNLRPAAKSRSSGAVYMRLLSTSPQPTFYPLWF
jgi:hypothetical protein